MKFTLSTIDCVLIKVKLKKLNVNCGTASPTEEILKIKYLLNSFWSEK